MTETAPVLRVPYRKAGLGPPIGFIVFMAVLLAVTVGSAMPWRSDPLHWLLGATSAVVLVLLAMLAVGTARAVVRAATGRPLLTLDADGVELHSVRLRLPWSNVDKIRLMSSSPRGTNMVLVFVPRDLRPVTRGRGPWMRWTARDYTRRYGSPLMITVNALAVDVDEVLRVASRYTDAPVSRQYPVGRNVGVS